MIPTITDIDDADVAAWLEDKGAVAVLADEVSRAERQQAQLEQEADDRVAACRAAVAEKQDEIDQLEAQLATAQDGNTHRVALAELFEKMDAARSLVR